MSGSIGSMNAFVAWTHGSVYFRILGWGLRLDDARLHPPLFSERNGFVRVLRLGPWRLKLLRRGA